MRIKERVLLGSVLTLGLAFGQTAMAGDPGEIECSMAKWNGAAPTVPAAAAGSPKSPAPVARYSEFCGLAVSATGYVQSPSTSDSRYFGRFYALPQLDGSGTVDLLVAYSTAGGNPELFKVSWNGSDFVFDATGAAGGTETIEGVDGEWNLVEFEFNSGGDFNMWVNEDWDFAEVDPSYGSTSAAPISSGTGSVAFVQMGAPNGMGGFSGGKVTFDAYEAHRSTNVGALMAGDVTQDGIVDIFDVVGIVNEINPPQPLNTGQPDCKGDGVIDIFDVVCAVNKL